MKKSNEKEEGKLNILARKVQAADHSIPLILVLLVTTSTVLAVAYIVYQFNISATVDQYPKVTFWEWSSSQKKNSFGYSVRIFPSIKTVDENITYGLYCDDTSGHTCYLRINSITYSSNIARLNIKIYDSSETIYTKEWIDFSSLPTGWESFTAGAGKKYSIWIEITASSGATVPSTSVIAIDMRVESP